MFSLPSQRKQRFREECGMTDCFTSLFRALDQDTVFAKTAERLRYSILARRVEGHLHPDPCEGGCRPRDCRPHVFGTVVPPAQGLSSLSPPEWRLRGVKSATSPGALVSIFGFSSGSPGFSVVAEPGFGRAVPIQACLGRSFRLFGGF